MAKQLTFVPFPEDRSKVRAYYKYELAQLYNISPDTLVKYLNRFLDALQSLGYRKHDKILTHEMVSLLFSKLGEP